MAKKPRHVVPPSKSLPPDICTERKSERPWEQPTDTLNGSSNKNTSNLSSLPSTVPQSCPAQQPTVPNSLCDAPENRPVKTHRRAKGGIDSAKMSTNDAGKPSDETNSGIASPPKLPKRKSKVRPQKKPETESVPLPAPPAKRSRPVVEDEEEDVGSLRSKKRKKIGQTVPVAEEASRASSTNKRTEADQVHRELQQSFISLQKSFSACGNSVTVVERRLSKHFSQGKRKRAKPAKVNIVTSTSDSFAAAKLWLSATSTAPSQDALGDNSTASTSNTTHLDAPSSTQPSSTSIFDFSLDLTNTTRNDDEDRADDYAIEFEEANKTPTPAQSTKILRFLQEVEVFEGSERRICYLRKALDVEGDEDAELRKEAMPTKERIVDAWTVMRLTPTSSPTYEDTDEEEVDELASSPVKIKPIDYGDSEEDDEDGIESLFTPPPRKKKRVGDLISFEDHGERYDEGGTSVALSPSPSGPDADVLFRERLRTRRSEQTHDNADVTEAPLSISSPKSKKRVKKREEKTFTPSKSVSTSVQESEPPTSKAPKRKRQTSKDDPSRSKKPKPEQSTSKQAIPASGPAGEEDTKAMEESDDQLEDEEEVGAWEHKLRAMERQLYEHLEQRKEKEQRGERDSADDGQELYVMSRQLNEHIKLHEERQQEIQKQQREEEDRAEEARQKNAREDQVRVLKEKQLPKRGFCVNDEEEEEVEKETSRVGEMLRIEKESENSELRRARQKKTQK